MAGSNALKKYLEELSQQELVDEISRLYHRFPLVRDYYTLELGVDSGKLLSKYKTKMKKLFQAKGDYLSVDINTSNKLIKDFTSISVNPTDLIDLKLYKVELCVEFLEQWGLEFANVEKAVANSYPDVLDAIYENRLEQKFKGRCEEVEGFALNYGLIQDTLIIDDDDEPEDS